MSTVIASALAHGSATEAANALSSALNRKLAGQKGALGIAFASTRQPLRELLPLLRERVPAQTWLAASTAGEFTEAGDAKGAVAALVVAGDFQIRAGIGRNLGADVKAAVQSAAASLPASMDRHPHRTLLMLVDPLSGKGEEATQLAGALFGGAVRLAGGAAGDDLKMDSAEIALDGTVARDAVVLAAIYSKAPLGVGVQHAHLPISKPMKVTAAQGNVVSRIDGKPAWEMWVEATKQAAGLVGIDPSKLPADQIGGFLLRYEAGIAAGRTFKVRAPLSKLPDGSLSFACGMPEGAVFQVMESAGTLQISSAREAARRAKAQMGNAPVAGAIVFDCICRNLILGTGFAKAVGAIREELGGAPFAGFETYGEIALDAGDLSGFHNTTTVVLAFPQV